MLDVGISLCILVVNLKVAISRNLKNATFWFSNFNFSVIFCSIFLKFALSVILVASYLGKGFGLSELDIPKLNFFV